MLSVSSLYQTHAKAVRRRLRRKGLEGPEGEELMHDVFVVALQRVDKVPQGEADARRWLLDVARKLAANYARLFRHSIEECGLQECIARAVAEPTSPEDAFAKRDHVRRTLRTLTEEEQDLLVGYDVERETLDVFSKRYRISRSATHARIRKARERFRASYRRLEERERYRLGATA